MAKPVPVRVPSDDCIVTIGGIEYHTHEGEWVEVIPGISVGDLRVLRQLMDLKVQIDAVAGEDDEQARTLALMDVSLGGLLGVLRRVVVGWNWTDDQGRAYPQPAADAAVLERLRIEELYYLTSVMRGETPGAEKNGLRPSPITS